MSSLGAIRLPVVSVSAGSRGSSPDAIVTAGALLWLGLHGRVGSGGVVFVEPRESSLVVRPLQSSVRGFPRQGSPRPSLLVRRLRPGVGGSSPRPVCFGPLVSGGALPVHQPLGALRDPPGTPLFLSSVAGSCGRGLRGQHHLSLLRGGGGGGGCQTASKRMTV